MSELTFDEFMQCTPPEVAEAAKTAVDDLVPTKSSSIYEAAYRRFIKWTEKKNVTNYSENVLLAYFLELAKEMKMKCSTMWSHYSMIKSMLNIKNGLDISKYVKLRAFLKKQSVGYIPKKSKVFTKAQFEKFLCEADDKQYLGMKIVLLIGISGACRCDEMVKMKIDDIENLGSLLLIKIPDSKTNKPRSFTIVGEMFINIFKKYASLRPNGFDEQRFFLKYANGKCTRSVMGIHKIGAVPKEVASYLKLPNPNEYTGHCLRRTSATLLVDGGGDITSLKRHGGWRSSNVAEGYIEESLTNKNDTAMKILSPIPNVPVSSRMDAPLYAAAEASMRRDSSISADVSSTLTSSGFNFQNACISNCTFNLKFVNEK